MTRTIDALTAASPLSARTVRLNRLGRFRDLVLRPPPTGPSRVALRAHRRYCRRQGRGRDFKDKILGGNSDSEHARVLLQHVFPGQSGDVAQVVFHTTARADSPANHAAIDSALAPLRGLPHVTGLRGPFPTNATHQISPDGHIAYAVVQFDDTSDNLPTTAVQRVVARHTPTPTPGSSSSSAAHRSQPSRRPIRRERRRRHSRHDHHLAPGLRILHRDGSAHPHCVVWHRDRIRRAELLESRLRRSDLRWGARGADRSGRWNRLRPVRHHAISPRAQRRDDTARRGRYRDDDFGPSGVLRRLHGRHLTVRTLPFGPHVRVRPRARSDRGRRVGPRRRPQLAAGRPRLRRHRHRPIPRSSHLAPWA